ncbi:PSD1 and planctomycete cytochrome C domain-containing protein [Aureliella helgolandensis]|nr:PSD1 and planctomycete cytochrome C domain-containing protein [Aureliella helgolandensis]
MSRGIGGEPFASPPTPSPTGEAVDFFEKEIRPILIAHCVECHRAEDASGGFRADDSLGFQAGGDSGPAIVPGAPGSSRLIQAVRREGELVMPPDEPLAPHQVDALERWVQLGAVWPATAKPLRPASMQVIKTHWAFQPIADNPPPNVPDPDNWIQTPVDAFVLAQLNKQHIVPSPRADRRTLIRRVTYALTGLPPTPEKVAKFLNDESPQAYEALVEELLASAHYGEHWARHWLDVARYSDTKGYVYAREERNWVHAWGYRDWVIQALNKDMPYDRFLLLQLAADQVVDPHAEDLLAMGFLTLGRRFLGVQRDIIDDRIDVVCRGMLGLTVSCARCHDHKYDPIPTADYYSLYGVFNSCIESLDAIHPPGDKEAEDEVLEQRKSALREALREARTNASNRACNRVADYLFAQSELDKYPANGFDQIFQPEDLLPEFVRSWQRALRHAEQTSDPVFMAWLAFAKLDAADFQAQAVAVTQQLAESSPEQCNALVRQAFEQPPTSFREVCDRYGLLFTEVQAEWMKLLSAADGQGTQPPSALPNPAAEALRGAVLGKNAACQVPAGGIYNLETYFDSDTVTKLWKLQAEVDRRIMELGGSHRHALTLHDREHPVEPRIFLRGNPLNQGEDVPRRFLQVLSQPTSAPFEQGSGRLELAREIISPENPLTARVAVNRIWASHFGTGLVATPSDFGTRAAPPSHPQLLDWLASQFVEQEWSLKQLHRHIVLSSTFQQASRTANAHAESLDPQNRWLWRMNPQRLSFEEFRDSLLRASLQLDPTLGGAPSELFTPPYMPRRTVYGLVDRQYLPTVLRVFDFANPDLHVPQRNETTVPQQALFFMNHPLILEQAQTLAEQAGGAPEATQRVTAMFQHVFQRPPTTAELTTALQFVALEETSTVPTPSNTATDWEYGYGRWDRAQRRAVDFSRLPHFTGTAWQGGEHWPDGKLGWAQLTASGGHPGNDRDHAVIRRWTAPRALEIELESHVQHEAAAGDGIRAFIAHSQRGELWSAAFQQESRDFHIDRLEVQPGDQIDFVVDIGEGLNSDQFLWDVRLKELKSDPTSSNATAATSLSEWSSLKDFESSPPQVLNRWEQLAQILLCSNEFLFVD